MCAHERGNVCRHEVEGQRGTRYAHFAHQHGRVGYVEAVAAFHRVARKNQHAVSPQILHLHDVWIKVSQRVEQEASPTGVHLLNSQQIGGVFDHLSQKGPFQHIRVHRIK